MVRRQLALAASAAAAIILSAPFVQQAFDVLSTAWPSWFRTIAITATVVPACAALLHAATRIHDRYVTRYGLLALAIGIAAGYVVADALSVTESVHFVEYGVLGLLFYRAWRPLGDVSLLILPLVAGTIAGTFDEWFQWFIPIRAGEARDIVLNAVASLCGVLFAAGIEPPARLAVRLQPGSALRLGAWTGAGLLVFAGFFVAVHVGYDVADPEIGSFRSRYSGDTLARLSLDRSEQWSRRPPVARRWLWREDQYLSEGLWHVGRRNDAWEEGDVATAWWENRILEKYYAPVLDGPTYASAAGHRWSIAQREDAAERAGHQTRPHAGDVYAYPLYVWPAVFRP
jgi:hypothetical protein